MVELNRIIIVEGPQGTGKTTLSNYLRENIPASNLYRLSGQKDKTLIGKEKSTKMYQALINYLKDMQNVPMDLIFDRTFTAEEVYGRLGYKEYSFTNIYQELVKNLCNLNYEIYYFALYLENTESFQNRIKRVHHQYQTFSKRNSIDQQQAFLEIADELEKTKIHVIRLAMDDFEQAYQNVREILKIELKEE